MCHAQVLALVAGTCAAFQNWRVQASASSLESHRISSVNMPRESCQRCLRPLSVCYCAHISVLENRWPVYIIQDIREHDHALGTARIAALSLSNCHLICVDPDQVSDDNYADLALLRAMQPVLVYPGQQAQAVNVLVSNAVTPLLFIDASWRRSRKIMHVLPWLAELPRFALEQAPPSRYRIRQQPNIAALATLEAIVYTLKVLEPPNVGFDRVLATMDWVVDQQICRMGQKIYQANYLNQDSV